MSATTILIGLLLVIEGLLGFFTTGAVHPTALIPSGFGLLITLSGLLARKEKFHMHAMHVAVLLALIGFSATVPAFAKIPLLINHTAGEKAVLEQIKKRRRHSRNKEASTASASHHKPPACSIQRHGIAPWESAQSWNFLRLHPLPSARRDLTRSNSRRPRR